MTSKCVGKICVLNENMNASKYIKEILQSKLELSTLDLFQDNEAKSELKVFSK